jgi:hypothetical protein
VKDDKKANVNIGQAERVESGFLSMFLAIVFSYYLTLGVLCTRSEDIAYDMETKIFL